MITPSFAITATERVLPKLALDFTTASLDSRITFTRTTDATHPATYVNSSGTITTATDNQPRFDYDPITLACKGLLIEESRSNLATYSEDFRNTATVGSTRPWVWSNSSVSINPSGAPVTPANTSVANKLIENTSASTTHSLQFGFGIASGTYTFSIYAKAAERSWIRLSNNTATGSNGSAYFNLSNGTIGAIGGGSASIQAVGNGWYRCSVTGTLTVSNTAAVFLATGDNGQSYTGDGSSGVYIWGAQFEQGAFPTSYIPTTTTSVTRNADVVEMTGTNFSSWWQVTTGGMLVRARQSAVTGIRPWAHISDGTADNIISLRGNAANPELYIKATTDQAQIDAGTLAVNTSYGLVGAWNTNDCAVAINGGAAVADTSATIPTVDRMLIGSDGTNYLSGWAEKISYWPQRITNAETQAFSK